MDTMIYLDQENGRLTTPAIKSRSAPDQRLKTPLTDKSRKGVSLQSSRKALGVVNKIVATSTSIKAEEKIKTAEAKFKVLSQPSGEKYPETEKCFPFDPSEFETYRVQDEVSLSRISLSGLGQHLWLPVSPVEELLMEDSCLPPSPLKMPKDVEYIDQMEAFLQTIDELTVDLPPEYEF